MQFHRACALGGLLLLPLAPWVNAAQRTFVSTNGADANACSLAAPCRGFAKAITVTDPGGELVVLDSGGYGSVTVNKDVTIVAPAGVYAGVSVLAASDGVTIAAPATKVVLRGLTINGQGGNNGIRIQSGEVHVESSVISNMGQAGIRVEGGTAVRISGAVSRSNADGLRIAPGAGTVSVLVRDSEFSNNSTAGIGVSPSAGVANVQVTVEHSSITKNGAGLVAAPGASAQATVVVTQSVTSENAGAGVSSTGGTATVFVRDSAITRNGTGLLQASSGVLNACGANLLVANTTPQSGAINTSSCLDVASGSGTVTSVATGTGLTGGPITNSGTINLAATQLLPTVACTANQIPKWNGSAWTCSVDATGAVSGAFVQGGNAFGSTAMLGATDNQMLTLIANNQALLRLRSVTGGTLGLDATANVIAGHPINSAAAGVVGATIAGGGDIYNGVNLYPNAVNGDFGTIGGGWGNTAGAANTTIGGGALNVAASVGATVGGGSTNGASGLYSTIAGGDHQSAPGSWATIGGGKSNNAYGIHSVVGGGETNAATGSHATISGGIGNIANADYTIVGGGSGNRATVSYATVVGGLGNFADEDGSAIGGGVNNHTTGFNATIGGGYQNVASGARSTVGGGDSNTASGANATVPGGQSNEAAGVASYAAGHDAHATHSNAFVWNGFPGPAPSFADYRFHVFGAQGLSIDYGTQRLDGGGNKWVLIGPGTYHPNGTGFGPYAEIFEDDAGDSARYAQPPGDYPATITAWNGAALLDAGYWVQGSDANIKRAFEPVDKRRILRQLVAMPITSWQYKVEPERVRHVGPTAQDFIRAFGIGVSDTHLSSIDTGGIAMAAIQGLHELTSERFELQQGETSMLRSRLSEQQALIEQQMREIESLRAEVVALDALARNILLEQRKQ